jgi:orotate phosphoribosyltransferase
MDVERALRETGGILEGHFVLSSGRHADRYLQLAAPFQRPEVAQALARALAERVRAAGLRPAVVLGPALGAIIPGYELARALGLRSIFCEREADGRFALRRGFALAPDEPVLVCENTLSTGGSALEAMAVVRQAGAAVIGVAVYCNRIPDPARVFDVPYVALAHFHLPSWPAEECPLCREGSAAVKPGSRPRAFG